MPHHLKGLVTVSVGVFALSFDALLVRLADTTVWNVVFWRGMLIFLALLLLLMINRLCSKAVTIGSLGGILITATIAGTGLLLFPLSLGFTSTANTVVILTSAPFFAALLSRILLNEQIPRRTWIAIGVVFGGIVVIFAGSFSSGGLVGDSIALLAAINFGLSMTLLRSMPGLSRIAITCTSGLISAVFCIPFADPMGLSSSSYQVLAFSGFLQMPAAMVLISIGTRYLPAAEVSLLILIEAVLAPVWVWIVLNEVPGKNTIYGGLVILTTLVIHSWLAVRTKRKENPR